MKRPAKKIVEFLLAIFLGCLVVNQVSAEDDWVEARIGIMIKSGKKEVRAEDRNKVKAGNLFRIYVHPQENVFIYVIHTDGKTATLLNMTMQKIESTILCLPSMCSYYKVDGSNTMENITIICSAAELPRLSKMIDRDLPNDQWKKIEHELNTRGEILLVQVENDNCQFEGPRNVRGIETLKVYDPFIKDLPIYSGRGLLLKKYEFFVQK
ncbi:MAG: hypothetical protein JW786_09195 [Desulfobacterales bacterium]|nr:hypothetical protein [Desulfobacterales bacterium]